MSSLNFVAVMWGASMCSSLLAATKNLALALSNPFSFFFLFFFSLLHWALL